MAGRASFGVVVVVAVAVAGACVGQEGVSVDLMSALKQGQLTVWVVVQPSGLGRLPRQAGVPVYKTPTPGYHESTTGSLGQDSASFGQAAGSYGVDSSSSAISAPSSPSAVNARAAGENAPAGSGYQEQTSGSFGQVSGGYGQTAGSYGQTTGSLGAPAGSVGTPAAGYGQSVGSFGNSLGTIADAGANMAKRGLGATTVQGEMQGRLRQVFPDLSVAFTTIPVDELADDLRVTRGTSKYPDVLMGLVPAQGLIGGPTLAMLQHAGGYDDGVTTESAFAPEFYVLAAAPHQQAARAFAAWVAEDGEGCRGCVADGLSKEERAAAAVAVLAVKKILRGEVLGMEADKAMVAFPPNLGRAVLLTTEGRLASESDARVEIVNASVSGKLGVVTMRVVPGASGVLGVAHTLVVLRRSDDGVWRVLHVSLNLPALEAEMQRAALGVEACTDAICGKTGVKPVQVVLPRDGDLEPPMPQLWWDNGGGSRLEVVEWQTDYLDGWSDARLFLVSDRGAKLRTQVTARFAAKPTRYRWRVWSVGAGGEVRLSGWRVMLVVR